MREILRQGDDAGVYPPSSAPVATALARVGYGALHAVKAPSQPSVATLSGTAGGVSSNHRAVAPVIPTPATKLSSLPNRPAAPPTSAARPPRGCCHSILVTLCYFCRLDCCAGRRLVSNPAHPLFDARVFPDRINVVSKVLFFIVYTATAVFLQLLGQSTDLVGLSVWRDGSPGTLLVALVAVGSGTGVSCRDGGALLHVLGCAVPCSVRGPPACLVYSVLVCGLVDESSTQVPAVQCHALCAAELSVRLISSHPVSRVGRVCPLTDRYFWYTNLVVVLFVRECPHSSSSVKDTCSLDAEPPTATAVGVNLWPVIAFLVGARLQQQQLTSADAATRAEAQVGAMGGMICLFNPPAHPTPTPRLPPCALPHQTINLLRLISQGGVTPLGETLLVSVYAWMLALMYAPPLHYSSTPADGEHGGEHASGRQPLEMAAQAALSVLLLPADAAALISSAIVAELRPIASAMIGASDPKAHLFSVSCASWLYDFACAVYFDLPGFQTPSAYGPISAMPHGFEIEDVVIDAASDTVAWVGRQGHRVVVAFRGTSSQENVNTDLNFSQDKAEFGDEVRERGNVTG